MRYWFMLLVAGTMAIISSLLTAFGMAELFSGVGSLILVMFVIIDLGRFLLFNFVVDEWVNLRKVKYFICLILCMLFVYSGIGIFAKLESLVAGQTKEAMINIASYIKAEDNANLKQTRSEDLAQLARKEYDEAMEWNRLDYDNCIKRANKNPTAENNCNNTKRRLDKSASATLQAALDKADKNLEGSEDVVKQNAKNKSEISSILFTICKLSQKECKSYDDLQLALSILIFLVIIGTDYLQIAIVLAVNTRKNKIKEEKKKEIVVEEKIIEDKQKKEDTPKKKLTLFKPFKNDTMVKKEVKKEIKKEEHKQESDIKEIVEENDEKQVSVNKIISPEPLEVKIKTEEIKVEKKNPEKEEKKVNETLVTTKRKSLVRRNFYDF